MLLIVAALASQFSAAVADTNGGGGLFSELTKGRLGSKWGYLIIAGLGVVITWFFEVFEIIALASKAFAFYYAIQMLEALLTAFKLGKIGKGILFSLVFLICVSIVLFGIAAE